jgi:hypothetical protein
MTENGKLRILSREGPIFELNARKNETEELKEGSYRKS